jgi:transcriptional regulator with XRE-family HTH domain
MKYIGGNINFMADNISSLGEWIREGLARLGKNQTWLANKIGVEPPQMSRIITGASPTTIDNLIAIADALGKPRSQVFRAAGYIEPIGLKDELDEAFLYNFRKLPEDEKEKWLRRLESDVEFYEQKRSHRAASKTRT